MAGLLDGEGTITLGRTHKGRQRVPVVSVASTDREVLDWVKDHFGGTITKKATYQDHHLPSFAWKVESRKAIAVLQLVGPYLRIHRKQRRAKHILGEYLQVTPRNGKYTDEMLEQKHSFDERFFSL